MVVAVDVPGRSGWPLEDRLAELCDLVRSAGGQVVDAITQRRDSPDPATVVGRGKLEALRLACEEAAADLVVVDRELSPAQARNLERALGVRVIDRTQLILDIFAQRAQSREGKLQVELAQLTYLLPRLTGRGTSLSRLGGGIGTRGPGETKLETDRRRIRVRIQHLRHQLAEVARRRGQLRRRRRLHQFPAVVLVGYTNAGKSTLFERLTGSPTLVADRLFATLDPMTRRLALPGGDVALLTDTVGFIHELPHDLVAAFRATLEEVAEADLLLHVVDASHPQAEARYEAAVRVLEQLGAADRPSITVWNKVDRLPPGAAAAPVRGGDRAVAVSAVTGQGLEELKQTIADALRRRYVRARWVVPYAAAHLVSELHGHGRVLRLEYAPDGIHAEAELRPHVAARLERRLRRSAPSGARAPGTATASPTASRAPAPPAGREKLTNT